MYNRYIPQADGSYRRNRAPDGPPQHSPSPLKPPSPLPPEPSEKPQPRPQTMGVSNFLRQILPANFDTGDLIVVLLLLLMAADRQEEQNTALLTLALYFFL